MKSIADNRAYQQALTFYDEALLAFHDNKTEEARGEALEYALNQATEALQSVVDAHCAGCIAEFFTRQRSARSGGKTQTQEDSLINFPHLKRPAKDDKVLQHALSDLVDAAISLHQAGGMTKPEGAPFDVALSAIWDTINAGIEAYASREVAHALASSPPKVA